MDIKERMIELLHDESNYRLIVEFIEEVISDKAVSRKEKSAFDNLYAHVINEGKIEARDDILGNLEKLHNP